MAKQQKKLTLREKKEKLEAANRGAAKKAIAKKKVVKKVIKKETPVKEEVKVINKKKTGERKVITKPAGKPVKNPTPDIPVGAPLKGMTDKELKELTAIEKKLTTASKSWLTEGECFNKVTSKQLWRKDYKDMEHYAETKWFMTKTTLYRKINGFKVIKELKEAGIKELPLRESQVRPITKLTMGDSRIVEVWQAVLNTEETPTAVLVKDMYLKICEPEKWEELQNPSDIEDIPEGNEEDNNEEVEQITVERDKALSGYVQQKDLVKVRDKQIIKSDDKIGELEDLIDEFKTLMDEHNIDYSHLI